MRLLCKRSQVFGRITPHRVCPPRYPSVATARPVITPYLFIHRLTLPFFLSFFLSFFPELELELEKDSHKDLRTNLSDSFRESDDAKTDSNSDELTSPASAKNKRKTSLAEPGTESDDSSSNAGPRQRRHAVKAVVKEKDALVTVKVPPSQVKTYIKAELVVDRYFAHCYQVSSTV